MTRAKGESKAGQTRSGAAARAVRELQQLVLESILTGQPLPGGGPVSFPDQAFLDRQAAVFIEDANVKGKLSVGGSKPVRVVSADAIQKEAESAGELTYLRFDPPRIAGEEVSLTLHGKIAAGNARTAGLSTVEVKFRRTADGWEVVDNPTYSAA